MIYKQNIPQKILLLINFHESNGKIGNGNYISNETSLNFNENSSLIFKTRRNRKISLTEYYDFVYEYQNIA